MFLQIHILIIPRFPYVEKGGEIYFVYLTIIHKIVSCWQLIYSQIYPIMIAPEETLLRQLPRYSIAKEYRARVFRLGISLFPFLFIARASLSPVCRNMPSHAAYPNLLYDRKRLFQVRYGYQLDVGAVPVERGYALLRYHCLFEAHSLGFTYSL